MENKHNQQKMNFLDRCNPFRKSQLKKDEEKKALDQKVTETETNLTETKNIQKDSLEVQKDTVQLQKEFQEKLDKVNQKEVQLLEWDRNLREKEEEYADRNEKLRKDISMFEIRDKGLIQDQNRVDKKDRDLDEERENIKNREEKSNKTMEEAEEKEKEFTSKLEDLEYRETSLNRFKEELDHRNEECIARENDSKMIYQNNIDEKNNLEELRTKFQKEHEELEFELREKIEEYDRKCEDFEAIQDTMDSIAFDKSLEGRQAKIVVKEALRATMEQMKESLDNLKEIDKMYNKGTFKGFAIPLKDIDKIIKQVSKDFEGIVEHNNDSGSIFEVWIEKIEEHIAEGGKSRKKHLYGDTYRNYVYAQAYCESYLVMVNIIYDYTQGGDTEEDSETSNETTEEWKDYYDIFGVSPTATQEELKKKYRTLAKGYHPDNNEGNDEMMKLINEAWEILQDEKLRSKYDSTYEQMKKQYNKKGA